MPVAVRLSKNFYERSGDEATNELVTVLNDVDFTYRSELTDLNARNFVLFDAKLDQRFAEQDAKIEKRFAEMDLKFEKRFAEMDVKFEAVRADLIKWMFGFWATNTLALIGIAIAIFQTR